VLLRSVEKRDMVSAMSWVLIPALIGPIIGPPLGGFIITYLNWRWIFYINVPIGILGVVLVSLFIAETRGETPKSFDLAGMVLSSLALGSLLFGFEMASHAGELDLALCLILTGLIAGALYLYHAKRVPEPILDPSLMDVPSFGLSVAGGAITRITQGAQPFLLPLMFQLGFGLSALQSGMITLAGAIGSFVMKAVAPRVLRRYGFRDAMIVNGVVCSGGYALCALFRPDWPITAIFAILVACGFFMSFQFTAYNTIAYDNITPQRLSSATSFYTTFQQLMLSVGVCTGAAALQAGMLAHHHATPQLNDFSAAFLTVTAISVTATICNWRFAPEAGVEFSGHTPRTWSLRQALNALRGLNP
jgi:MFS family permease